MKLPLQWVREFVSFSLTPQQLAEKLTLAGLEVEEISDVGGELVFEVTVTPNRSDCLSITGMAREIAAITGARLKYPYPARWFKAIRSKGGAPVAIRETKLCTRYCGQILDNVVIGPSPDWLQRRLEVAGIRSLNNVVDATNYVMLESGQPLHAFDRSLLAGGKVCVRRASQGEGLVTIDGKERLLVPDDLVIADDERPVAIAGVMGGHESEVQPTTRTLFLESACFDPATVRRTSRRLGLATESSYRFERGVDWFGVRPAMLRLVAILQEIAGGTVVGSLADHFAVQPKPRRLSLTRDEVQGVSGGTWQGALIVKTLQRISAIVKGRTEGPWQVTVPSHRLDLREGVDLVEEVVRLRGFQEIGSVPLMRVVERVPQSEERQVVLEMKRHLRSLGFYETVHFSFCGGAELRQLGGDWLRRSPELANPLGEQGAYLRPTLLVSLLHAAAYHSARQLPDLRLFEFRRVFARTEREPSERLQLAGLLVGCSQPIHWLWHGRKLDFYEAKGVVESILEWLSLPHCRFQAIAAMSPYEGVFHPGRSAAVICQGTTIGVVGELHPARVAPFGLKFSPYLFELDWEGISPLRRAPTPFQPYSVYPSVLRDLAVVVDEAVPADEIASCIQAAEPRLIRSVQVFDLYRGAQIPAGKKSLAFNICMGLADRTLTDSEVDTLHKKIIQSLRKELQAEVR